MSWMSNAIFFTKVSQNRLHVSWTVCLENQDGLLGACVTSFTTTSDNKIGVLRVDAYYILELKNF